MRRNVVRSAAHRRRQSVFCMSIHKICIANLPSSAQVHLPWNQRILVRGLNVADGRNHIEMPPHAYLGMRSSSRPIFQITKWKMTVRVDRSADGTRTLRRRMRNQPRTNIFYDRFRKSVGCSFGSKASVKGNLSAIRPNCLKRLLCLRSRRPSTRHRMRIETQRPRRGDVWR